MTRHRPLAVVAAGVALFALLLASCSGSTTSQPTPASNSAPNSAAVQTTASNLGAHAVLNAGTSGQDAVGWVLDKVGGGILGAAGSKAFNDVMVQLGLNSQTNELTAMKGQLDQIQGQLQQLNDTMATALQAIREVGQDVLAQRIVDLRDRLVGVPFGTGGAQGDFREALSYAGQPDKKSTIDGLTANVERDVNDPGGLANTFPGTTMEAILPSPLISKPFYRALSDATTGRKPFFTWRDSAALDNVFQYLLTLQALQLNLIVQVRTKQGSSPDQIYDRFWKPYVGDKASFQDYLNGKVPAPTGGFLQQQRATELKRVPTGAVIQRQPQLMWSVDMPSGAKDLSVTPSGPGYPVCNGSDPNTRITCVNDSFGPSSSQLIGNQAGSGYGAGWSVPNMAQLTGLLAGWSPVLGRSLEAQTSGSKDPPTCTPVKPGGAQAPSDQNTCIWPASAYWSDSSQEIRQSINWKPPQMPVQSNILTYDAVGWSYRFFNITNNSQSGCSISTDRLDWTALANKVYGHKGEFTTVYSSPVYETPRDFGVNLEHDPNCGGTLMLVRQVPAAEQYYFPL